MWGALLPRPAGRERTERRRRRVTWRCYGSLCGVGGRRLAGFGSERAGRKVARAPSGRLLSLSPSPPFRKRKRREKNDLSIPGTLIRRAWEGKRMPAPAGSPGSFRVAHPDGWRPPYHPSRKREGEEAWQPLDGQAVRLVDSPPILPAPLFLRDVRAWGSMNQSARKKTSAGASFRPADREAQVWCPEPSTLSPVRAARRATGPETRLPRLARRSRGRPVARAIAGVYGPQTPRVGPARALFKP